jgi:hypothetical protein
MPLTENRIYTKQQRSEADTTTYYSWSFASHEEHIKYNILFESQFHFISKNSLNTFPGLCKNIISFLKMTSHEEKYYNDSGYSMLEVN